MCIVLNEYYNFYYYDLDLQSDQAIFAYWLVYISIRQQLF